MLADHETGCESQLENADELDAGRQTLEAAQSEWQQECERREAELAQREQNLALREGQLARAEDSSDHESSAAPNPHDGSPESEQAATSSDSDYDPMAALEKLRQMVEMGEDEPVDNGSASSIPSSRQIESLASERPSESHPADDDDESIKAYMSQLMSRVNGQSEQTVPEPTTPAAATSAALTQSSAGVTTTNEPITQPGDDTDAPESADVVRPVPQKPRSAPPDLAKSLDDMRELANSSARMAIDKSERQKRNRIAFRGTAASVTAFVIITWLLFGLPDALMTTGLMGGFIGTAALLWHYRESRFLARIIRPIEARLLGTPVDDQTATDDTDGVEAKGTQDHA